MCGYITINITRVALKILELCKVKRLCVKYSNLVRVQLLTNPILFNHFYGNILKILYRVTCLSWSFWAQTAQGLNTIGIETTSKKHLFADVIGNPEILKIT